MTAQRVSTLPKDVTEEGCGLGIEEKAAIHSGIIGAEMSVQWGSGIEMINESEMTVQLGNSIEKNLYDY